MRDSYSKTEKILTEHFDKLELVANTLLKKEKISGDEFDSLMKNGALPEKEEVIDNTVQTQETQQEPEQTQE
jgi:cell division protease FtsH